MRRRAGFTHIMEFGKYEGMSLRQVVDKDPGYILWLKETVKTFPNIRSEVVTRAERALSAQNDYDLAVSNGVLE
jgi:hypothetical protein